MKFCVGAVKDIMNSDRWISFLILACFQGLLTIDTKDFLFARDFIEAFNSS